MPGSTLWHSFMTSNNVMVHSVLLYSRLTFPTLLMPPISSKVLQQPALSKGLTVFVQCLLFQTPSARPVSTTISMINNIYYKCMVYYAFYEASTNPWSLKHAFHLKFHLSQNNKRIITLQQHQQKKRFYFSITLYFLVMESQEVFIIIYLSIYLFIIWLQLFSL